MDKNLAISVQGVSKIYKLYDKPIDRLKEAVSLTHKSYHRDFFALSDISFDVKKGETVGIIGTNGSGKSTILKIITGVLSPTTGTAEVSGNISALLELGAGFNSEYTGLENIYMNGTMMGFSREEMQRRMDDILRFADIGDFVNQPVKTYSSGMFVRLAFALAINVDPEILIVDEALSVGDVFFQAKCYRRMEEMMKNGTTILMVSHDMGSIIKYCDKVVLLNRGHFVAQGEAGKMVDLYKKILANQTDELAEALIEQKKEALGLPIGEVHTDKSMKERMNLNPEVQEYGDGRASFEDFGTLDARGNVTNLLLKGEMFTIRERIRFHAPIEMPIFTYTLRDKKGTDITGTNTMFEGADIKPVKDGDVYTVSFRQKMNLQGGEYLLSMSCTGYENGEHVVYHRLYNVLSLTVISNKNTVGYYDMDSEVEAVREEKA
ncbi:ABC transporter ATP-binding protein [Stomatobaculum longum]|jgi:putative O-antigen ABC transporter, ATP-binding protein|uniref:ABC transporter ATP-binding protein n=1 Tax=Stomatobaculum longum TaxID=796942 RepID=UPI0028052E63|nr:ABC transporter ATP-binding protein [Stomatobaculum longum]